jgi:hypothetical protein
VAWHTGSVAPLTLQRFSVEDSGEGGRKRGAGGDVEQDGGSSSAAAAAVVAGAWLTPQKKSENDAGGL